MMLTMMMMVTVMSMMMMTKTKRWDAERAEAALPDLTSNEVALSGLRLDDDDDDDCLESGPHLRKDGDDNGLLNHRQPHHRHHQKCRLQLQKCGLICQSGRWCGRPRCGQWCGRPSCGRPRDRLPRTVQRNTFQAMQLKWTKFEINVNSTTFVMHCSDNGWCGQPGERLPTHYKALLQGFKH